MSVTTKAIGLASAAVLFAGMAFGQTNLSCSPTAPNAAAVISPTVPIELRSESATELVSDEIVYCQGAPAGSTAGQVTATLSGTGLLGITSKVLSTSTGVTEATLQVTSGGTTMYYQGTVSGTTITFGTAAAQVSFPTSAFTLQVSNVRVNATGQYSNNLQPVTETVQLIAQGNGLAAVTSIPAITVGNQRNSLLVNGSSSTGYSAPGSVTVSSSATAASNINYLVCQTTPGSLNGSGANGFSVTISEQFAGAFKTQAQVAPATINGIPSSEGGSLVAAGQPGVAAGTGVASFGTRIKLVFTGIPTNATLTVPTTITGTGGLVVNLLAASAGETGAYQAATTGVVSNNEAVYEVTSNNYTAFEAFTVTPVVTYSANSITVPAGPITVAVSYAPSPSTSGGTMASPTPSIPYFANTATTLTGAGFAACQTTLLFPFITNQQGFDTGIVVANTGLDYLNPTGKTTSKASGQAGACTFQFYGSVTGSTANPGSTPITSPNFPASTASPATIATGTTYAALLSGMSPGFQGYAIAVCPFLYAKGFAFIEYGLLTNQGVVEGYLADIISSDRTASSTNGVVVGNTSPEASGQ